MSDNPFAEPDDPDRTVIARRPAASPAAAGTRPDDTLTPGAAPRPEPSHPTRRPGRRPRRPGRPRGAGRARSRAAGAIAEGAETITLGVNPLSPRRRRCCSCWRGCATRSTSRIRGSARAGGARDARFRAARARPRICRCEQLRAGPLRALRQPRRRRAEHAVGQHRRVGRALAGLDLPPGSAQRRALLRPAWPDAPEPRHLPAGHRADVSLHVARVPGALPAVAARPGRARPAARGDLCADRAPAPGGRPDLSPHWRACRGALPARTRRRSRVWVVGQRALAALAGLFVWFSASLNAASDELFARMLRRAARRSMPTDRPGRAGAAAAAAEPEPAVDQLCAFLKPEINQGLVTVLCTPPTPVVRIRNRGMFASGSATVEPRFVPLLDRLGARAQGRAGARSW